MYEVLPFSRMAAATVRREATQFLAGTETIVAFIHLQSRQEY